MNLFQQTLNLNNQNRPPVWFMRQAGRYHEHYQNLKRQYSFMELCKDPNLSHLVALGPVEDFDFDAAILFSDLLFPLEHLGMELKYQPGPWLNFKVQTLEDLKKLEIKINGSEYYQFMEQSLHALNTKLDPCKGLIGFLGGPWTLFVYAAFHSHLNFTENFNSINNKSAFFKLFEAFYEKLKPSLLSCAKAQSNIDALYVMDTAAGELSLEEYQCFYLPILEDFLNDLRAQDSHLDQNSCLLKKADATSASNPEPHFPHRLKVSKKMLYFKKNTWEHLRALGPLPLDGIGMDHTLPIDLVLKEFSNRFVIQGNLAPEVLLKPWDEIERLLLKMLQKAQNQNTRGWICSLGHGVLQQTPSSNVKKWVQFQKEFFNSNPSREKIFSQSQWKPIEKEGSL